MSRATRGLWAIISNISIPFFGFVGPLIAYLMFKDRSAWLKEITTEALNFSILYTIAQIVGWISTSFVIGADPAGRWSPSWPWCFCILAAMAASKHEFVQVPGQLADHQVGTRRDDSDPVRPSREACHS